MQLNFLSQISLQFQTTALCGGNITSEGSSSVIVKGVCWSTSIEPTISDFKSEDGSGIGDFSRQITGLLPATKYFVRAYATSKYGTSYGMAKSLTTEPATIPVVNTHDVTAITHNTAICGGNITTDGGVPVGARGVCWSTRENPTVGNLTTLNGTGVGAFTSNLNGLSPNETYFVRAYAINSEGTAYGEQRTFTTQFAHLTVNTLDITAITHTTATCGGNVIADGGSAVTARGVCWNTSGNPTSADFITTEGIGLGTYISNITGLSPNTKYYIRAYATNEVRTAYGELKTFITDIEKVISTVITGKITNITATSVDCFGNVTADGGAVVTERGFCWNTSANPTILNSKMQNGSGLGAYSNTIINLSPNTTYNIRAYATNSVGTAYGEERSFTTFPKLPTVTTGEVTKITTISAACLGNVIAEGITAVTARGICWNTSGNPTLADFITTEGTGLGTFTSYLTSLSPNTTYYVRAYAANDEGTAYGVQESFKTYDESYTDSRDGKVYEGITIGHQVWMAENLAYLPVISPPKAGSYVIPLYYVYGYYGTNVVEAKATDEYCTYGVLYNWNAAMLACPEGWHLPNDDEWTILETYLANNGYNYDGTIGAKYDKDEGCFNEWKKIAKSMASASGWSLSDVPGSVGNTDYPEYRNKSGFSGLPGGFRHSNGEFDNIGSYGYWWSSSENYSYIARFLNLYFNGSPYSGTATTRDSAFCSLCQGLTVHRGYLRAKKYKQSG